jgi:hypothetical protein
LAVDEAGVHAASSPRVRSTMTLRTVRQSVAQGSGVTCNVPGECGTGVGVDCADAEAWHGTRAAGAVRVVQPTEVTVHLDHRVRDGSTDLRCEPRGVSGAEDGEPVAGGGSPRRSGMPVVWAGSKRMVRSGAVVPGVEADTVAVEVGEEGAVSALPSSFPLIVSSMYSVSSPVAGSSAASRLHELVATSSLPTTQLRVMHSATRNVRVERSVHSPSVGAILTRAWRSTPSTLENKPPT